MKKLLSFFCIVAMILTIVQVPAFAEEGDVVAPTLVRLDLGRNHTAYTTVGDQKVTASDTMSGVIEVWAEYDDQSKINLTQNSGLTYTSSNPGVVKVESDGEFSFQKSADGTYKEGASVITVKYGDLEKSMLFYSVNKKLERRDYTIGSYGDIGGIYDPFYTDDEVPFLWKDVNYQTVSKTLTSYIAGAWVYEGKLSGDYRYTEKKDGAEVTKTLAEKDTRPYFGIGDDAGTGHSIYFGAKASTDTIYDLYKAGNYANATSTSTQVNASDGWHQIMAAVKYDAETKKSNVTFYFDGVEVAEAVCSGDVKPKYLFTGKKEAFRERFIAPYVEFETAGCTGISVVKKDNASFSYNAGESFNKDSITVTASYSDGTSKEVTDYTVSPESFTVSGAQEVTISYEGFEAKVNVTVVGLTGISATTPVKEYKIGDSFDKSDITVTANYGSTEETVTDYTVSPESFTVSGEQEVTIEYGGEITTVTVMVHGITSVTAVPLKTEYLYGDKFDASDVTVKAVYGNGDEVEIADYTHNAPEAFEEAKTITIEIGYQGFTTSYEVTVRAVAGITVEKTDKFETASYVIGDTFAKNTVVVTATYEGTEATKEITDYEVEPASFTTSGDEIPVTISYCGLEDTSITVKVEKVESLTIEIKEKYQDKVYKIGDKLEDNPYTYYTVKATFSNNITKTLNSGATFAVGTEVPNVDKNYQRNVINNVGQCPISVRYKGVTATCYVPVVDIEHISVAEALAGVKNSDGSQIEASTFVRVEGYYAGVARDGHARVYELLLKDAASNKLISVRSSKSVNSNTIADNPANFPIYGAFPNFGYEVGQKIVLSGFVKMDDFRASYNENKKILSFDSWYNPDNQADTIIAEEENGFAWNMEDIKANAKAIASWDEMKDVFKADDVTPYTFFKISGDMYEYSTPSENHLTRIIHMNPEAKEEYSKDENGELILDEKGNPIPIEPEIYTSKYKDGFRKVGLREDVHTANLGEGWKDKLFGTRNLLNPGYPGVPFNNDFYALYVGGGTNYYNIVILDESWITKDAYDRISVAEDGAVSFLSAAAGEYKVIFADYEGSELKNCEIVTVPAEAFTQTAVTRAKSFELGTGDKIMLLDKLTSLVPLSKAYIYE